MNCSSFKRLLLALESCASSTSVRQKFDLFRVKIRPIVRGAETGTARAVTGRLVDAKKNLIQCLSKTRKSIRPSHTPRHRHATGSEANLKSWRSKFRLSEMNLSGKLAASCLNYCSAPEFQTDGHGHVSCPHRADISRLWDRSGGKVWFSSLSAAKLKGVKHTMLHTYM